MFLLILKYFLFFILLLATFIFLYIRIKYRFWTLQPVFHFYDIYYWLFNVGIIRLELPKKNRYTNMKQITTLSFDKLTKKEIKDFTLLVQLNYLRNNENTFTPLQNNIEPYFIGHNTTSFFSFYKIPDILIDNKTNTTVETEKIIGVMTSRPLHVKINTNEFDIYYVDYLCISKQHRKRNIAPQLIQTHEYNQSHSNKNISVSLFKREEELTGIIPLTVYKSYCFCMKKWDRPDSLHSKITLLTGDQQNMYYLYNFIKEIETKNKPNKTKFDITIYPEISNIIELVKTQNLFVKMLVVDSEIEAIYIFKKTCTFLEKDKEIISCIASINGNKLTTYEFIQGFKLALWSIVISSKTFSHLLIENISDNYLIINNISLKTAPFASSPMAYFFYNFAYSPFKSNKCLIIN